MFHFAPMEFTAYGPTLVEAKQRVQSACAKQNNEIHCRDASCEKNE